MSKIGSTFRLLRAGWVMTREGVFAAFPGEELSGALLMGWRICQLLTRKNANKSLRKDRLAKAMAKLGPAYVKLGQFLATRPDLVGKDMAQELAMLQDRMDTFPTQTSIAIIERSLGKPIDTIFEDFSEPIAAASIAQVHRANIKSDGHLRDVAVKIIRPGVRKSFARDLESYFLAARWQERWIPWLRRLKPVDIVRTLAGITQIEMDLRLEAAALSELEENTRNDSGFRTPVVDWERTASNVLTMEWIDGIKLNDYEGLEKEGHDRSALAVTLMQSFLRQTLRDGFFHADMHPGNLLVEKDSTIVALDLGIVGRLGKKERRFLAEILHGFITRDFSRVARVHFEAGYVPDIYGVASFAQAIRAIGEPIHGQSAEKISMAKLLTLLFEITEIFDMETRPELLMLQKTMVVVEGVARSLDPSFDMWNAAEPVVADWMSSNLGASGVLDDVCEGYGKLGLLARQAPYLARRAEKISGNIEKILDDLIFSKSKTGQIRIGLKGGGGSKWATVALWIIAFCCLYIVWSGA